MDNMQLWLSSSTDSINLNDSAEGFYLNPDLDGLTGLPEIRSVNGLNAGYDGGWTATQLWAARLITIRGVIAINDKAAVETKRKALAKILSQGKNEDLELKFVSEAGNTYTTTVRTSYCTMALQRVFWRQEYQIQLRANDPLIYDDGGSELIAILRVMAGEGGFEIPFDIPFTIGGSIEPTSVDVGDEATYPLIRLKGDLHNPTIINMTTNQRMQVLADIITTIEWHDYTTTYTTNGYVQIGNGLDGAPLSLTQLQGNASQKTTTGKNLIKFDDISMTNATIDNYFIDRAPQINTTLVAGHTYTFSADITIGGSVSECILSVGNGTTGYAGDLVIRRNLTSGRVVMTFTPSSAELQVGTNFYLRFPRFGEQVTTGVNYSLKNAMLEESATATPYEPYTAGASPNPSYPQTVNVVSGGQEVKITGKNLIETPDATVPQTAGMTAVWSNNVAHITGTNTSTSFPISSMIYLPTKLKKGTKITMSVGENAPYFTTFRFFSPEEGWWGAGIPAGSKSATATLEISPDRVQLYNGSVPVNTAKDYTISNFMLEFGEEATDYEPYQSQSQEINLGKNLLDLTSATSTSGGLTTTWTNNSATTTGTTPSGSGQTASTIAQLNDIRLPKGTYTWSIQSNAVQRLVIQLRDASTQSWNWQVANIAIGSKSTTFTIGYDADQCRIAYSPLDYATTYNLATDGMMLEAGTQATSFSPYKTPIELAKIGTYQDYIYKSGDDWYIHKEIGKSVYVGDNSEGWAEQWAGRKAYRVSNNDVKRTSGTGVVATAMSDYYTAEAVQTLYEQYADYGLAIASGSDYIIIRNKDCADATAFTTWLSTHSTTIYYALATPTDTEITDSDLIEQLNFVASLYEGVNNIMLIPSAGEQGEMTVSYATAEDIDYHEVVIDCQARTVTQDGHNLYPALAEGSEFIRLLPGENKLYLTSEVESDNGTAEVKFKKGNISI